LFVQQMMGGFEEHIRQLNNYNTIFGTFWFNILCVSCNLAEIICTVVLLGYYHNDLTIDYMWWPGIEMVRLFLLSMLRFDVMLKGVENYSDNRNGFKYTKRMILIINLIGFFFILIGGPVYLALLSTASNSTGSMTAIYTLFMSVYPSFMMVRALLSLPIFCTLITGTNPIYAINQGYQRIDDAVAHQHAGLTRQRRSQADGYDDDEAVTHDERVQRQIRREWRLMEMERRQMELAIDNSRRDAFRQDRKTQDQEYERALKEAEAEAAEAANRGILEEEESSNVMAGNMNNEAVPSSEQSASPPRHDADHEEEDIVLRDLPLEPEESSDCVTMRVRLPNGERLQRRFHYRSNIADVTLWTQHECKRYGQTYLIGNSQLISTMPRTVYDDMTASMETLRFWRPNAKRKIVSPWLYVEEE